jgi:hypothetical protein
MDIIERGAGSSVPMFLPFEKEPVFSVLWWLFVCVAFVLAFKPPPPAI